VVDAHMAVEGTGVLAVAKQVFSDGGFGVTRREIAHAAGVPISILHRDFRSKAELFLAAMAPPLCALEEAIRSLDPEGNLEEQLERVAILCFEYYRDLAPVLFVAATDLDFDYEHARRRTPWDPQVRLRVILSAFLRGHSRTAHVGEDALEVGLLNLQSVLHSLAFFEALGLWGGRCPGKVVTDQVALMLRGLLGTPSPGWALAPSSSSADSAGSTAPR
jgi:AcrR family transcriptional regulator